MQGTRLLIGCEATWSFGWSLVLLGFFSGALLGLSFLREDFLGGYASQRRRLVRLGHVALVALGLVNVVVSLAPTSAFARGDARFVAPLLMLGSLSMPIACFLTAWRASLRPLFALPVVALLAAVALLAFHVSAPAGWATSGVSP